MRSPDAPILAPVWCAMLGSILLLLTGSIQPARGQRIAIVGGTIYTVAGPPITDGTVLMEDGIITSVGREIEIPSEYSQVDASGMWVTPGLINAATQLGLIEIGTATDDGSLSDASLSPSFIVTDAVDPGSQVIPVTRVDGVTTALTRPTGGIISGQAVLVDLLGDRIEDMIVQAPAAMIAHIHEGARTAGRGSRAGVIALLREALEDTQEYERRREDFMHRQMQDLALSLADLEALVPVIRGELPLMMTANRRSDIESALRLAREFDLRLILASAEEGWMVADLLADAGVPVVIDPLSNIPSYDAPSPRLDNAAKLSAAGVEVVIATFDTHNARNIRQAAGNAVARGMEWDAALASVTRNAAHAFDVGDRYGTIEQGKVANVVLWSGDPFEFSTGVERVFIRGVEISMGHRQRTLMERYRSILEEQSSQ